MNDIDDTQHSVESSTAGQRLMMCLVCRHGETHPGETTVSLGLGSPVVVVHRTPAEVCENCGEPYIADPVAERLLEIAEAARRQRVSVLVRDFGLEA